MLPFDAFQGIKCVATESWRLKDNRGDFVRCYLVAADFHVHVFGFVGHMEPKYDPDHGVHDVGRVSQPRDRVRAEFGGLVTRNDRGSSSNAAGWVSSAGPRLSPEHDPVHVSFHGLLVIGDPRLHDLSASSPLPREYPRFDETAGR